MQKEISKWSVEDVKRWLLSCGLDFIANLFGKLEILNHNRNQHD